MKVQQLLDLLSKANPQAEINFLANMSNSDDDNCDIECNCEIFGQDIIGELESIDFMILPKVKSSEDFETIHELLNDCKKVKITMDNKGIAVYGDNELRRELDFDIKYGLPRDSEFVKKLIEIL